MGKAHTDLIIRWRVIGDKIQMYEIQVLRGFAKLLEVVYSPSSNHSQESAISYLHHELAEYFKLDMDHGRLFFESLKDLLSNEFPPDDGSFQAKRLKGFFKKKVRKKKLQVPTTEIEVKVKALISSSTRQIFKVAVEVGGKKYKKIVSTPFSSEHDRLQEIIERRDKSIHDLRKQIAPLAKRYKTDKRLKKEIREYQEGDVISQELKDMIVSPGFNRFMDNMTFVVRNLDKQTKECKPVLDPRTEASLNILEADAEKMDAQLKVKHGDSVHVGGQTYRYLDHSPKWFQEYEKARKELAEKAELPFHPNCFTPCSYIPMYGELGKQFIREHRDLN